MEENGSSSKREWTTLKVPPEIHDAFKEIKKSLKDKHGKSLNNGDVMRFLLYLAKIALELEGNPKLDGVAEPISYETLKKLENYSQHISENFGIPVEYVRGGVLWGLLEISKDNLDNWRVAEYYLKLAKEWVGTYTVNVYSDEVSSTLASIIELISRIGQNNPHRKEIQRRLFQSVEEIVVIAFLESPSRVIKALILNRLHTRDLEGALGTLKRALKQGVFKETSELEELVLKFLGEANRVGGDEILFEFVKDLQRACSSLETELLIVENAARYIDVKPFYEDLSDRGYLLPEDRLEVVRSMIRSASLRNDEELLSYAIKLAKEELEKLRQSDVPSFRFERRHIVEELAKNGLEDKVIELKFEDEVPSIGYYTIVTLSKLKREFHEGWREFKRLLNLGCKVNKKCPEIKPFEIFVHKNWVDIRAECLELSGTEEDLTQFAVYVWGDLYDLKTARIDVRCNNQQIISLGLSTGLPEGVLAKLLGALIKEGSTPMGDKILAARLLSSVDSEKDLARNILKDAINSMNSHQILYFMGDSAFLQLLNDLDFDPLELLNKALGEFFSENNKYFPYTYLKAFINALVFTRSPSEAFEIIENGRILDVIDKTMDNTLAGKLHTQELGWTKTEMIDWFVEAMLQKMGPRYTAKFILEQEIATSRLPWLIEMTIAEGDFETASKLASRFGLGWFGQRDLQALLEYRTEECINELKGAIHADHKDKEQEVPECYKAVMSLLRNSKKKVDKVLIGKLAGRLLSWWARMEV
ncbi:hypothetical protein A3L11_02695 [Thermococcus siculi]|uniref:Uncharacterized protein n=2 Tax=Thermococcus siculi TaxID=72803 RepID=A0A2Z2MLA0_9EURY|nr:hypothetical protein A3L11_02695 [Thermococcus siculi]